MLPSALEEKLTAEQRRRLTDVLDQYLERHDRGEAGDHDELLAAHPDLADVLRSYLSSLDFVQEAAAGFRPVSPDAGEPRRLGEFELGEELGRGGMGVVYSAHQPSLDREVAIKLLPASMLIDGRQVARFRNEAQAAARLSHPHIVPVYAVGADDGVHYFAMRRIDGRPLSEVIDGLRDNSLRHALTSSSSRMISKSAIWSKVSKYRKIVPHTPSII